MGRQTPIAIGGIHLDAHSGRIRVSVEIDNKWIEILNESNEGHVSHIMEPDGVRLRAKAHDEAK